MEYFVFAISILLFFITIRESQDNIIMFLLNIISIIMFVISLFYIIWK